LRYHPAQVSDEHHAWLDESRLRSVPHFAPRRVSEMMASLNKFPYNIGIAYSSDMTEIVPNLSAIDSVKKAVGEASYETKSS